MLVHAPEADITVAERVPPGVEHLAVEAEDAFAGYVCGRWGERGEAVIDAGAVLVANARDKMPERQSVVPARIGEDGSEQGGAVPWHVGSGIEIGPGLKESKW